MYWLGDATSPRSTRPMSPEAAVIACGGDDAGDRWATLQARLDALFAPVTRSRRRPRHGRHVPDIGGGDTVLAPAARVT